MAVSQQNRFRYRAILIAREVKGIFMGMPERFVRALAGRWMARWLLRAMFLAPDGQLHRAGEVVIADLRDFGFVGRTTFHPDAQEMARREGRREVVVRILNYLNLDEAVVQKIMELDDGLSGE